MKKYLWLTKTLVAVSLLLTLGAVQVRAQEAGTESHIAFEVVAGKLKEGVDMTAQRVADKAVEAEKRSSSEAGRRSWSTGGMKAPYSIVTTASDRIVDERVLDEIAVNPPLSKTDFSR